MLKHPLSHKVYNICGRDYKYNKFGTANVEIYKDWKDHHAPPIPLLFAVVNSMYKFLSTYDKNIVAIHCNAGKGRTGVAIASMLIYCHYIQNSDAALQYYSYMRFGLIRGVSHPCQLRTVQYFEQLVERKVKHPIAKVLKKIVITTIPKHSKEGIRPFVTIEGYNNGKPSGPYMIFSSKVEHKKQYKYLYADADNDQYMTMKICPDVSIILIGDVTMHLYHNATYSDTFLCRWSFNTSFVEMNTLTLTVDDVDPDRTRVDKRFNKPHFKIQVFFDDYCSMCSPSLGMCEKCQLKFPGEYQAWHEMEKILDVSV